MPRHVTRKRANSVSPREGECIADRLRENIIGEHASKLIKQISRDVNGTTIKTGSPPPGAVARLCTPRLTNA